MSSVGELREWLEHSLNNCCFCNEDEANDNLSVVHKLVSKIEYEPLKLVLEATLDTDKIFGQYNRYKVLLAHIQIYQTDIFVQIRDKFEELKAAKTKGYLVSYKDYNEQKMGYFVANCKDYKSLIKKLIDTFSFTYTEVVSILDFRVSYEFAPISTKVINTFINEEFDGSYALCSK